MSIQIKEYKSKKTGKTSKKYYACVFDSTTNSTIWGKGRSKRSEAVQDESDILNELEQGISKQKGTMAFKEVAELWFKSMDKIYAESTFKGYKGYYRSQLSPVFDDIKVNKITPVNIQRFKNLLSDKYKPATVNKTMDLMSMILDFAIKPLSVLKYNPCSDIKRDKVSPPSHTTWDEATIGYFLSLDSVINSDYYEMLILSFTTALRPGEVCGLSINSLKKDNSLALYRGYNKYGNITDMKTPGSHRPITLDPLVYQFLQKKLEKKKRQKDEFENKIKIALRNGEPLGNISYDDNDFLFTYENGSPITPNSYSRAFRNFIRDHNNKLKEIESDKGKIPVGEYYLPVIRLYDCRHSFATNSVINGENTKVISEIMGSRVDTVLKNYVHLGKTTHQATLSKYSQKIFNISDNKKEKQGNV